jgi:quercetin dioxygenase-like cupin family protein
MLLSRSLIIDGATRGTVFTFEKSGDVFPVHTHGKDDVHITIVAFGQIKCTGRPEIEGKIIEAKAGGTVLDWKPGEAHGFTALTDGATIINMLKKV